MQDLFTNFPVVVDIPVRWADMDPFQHVNNTVYFRYFEIARISYFERTSPPAIPQIRPVLGNRPDSRSDSLASFCIEFATVHWGKQEFDKWFFTGQVLNGITGLLDLLLQRLNFMIRLRLLFAFTPFTLLLLFGLPPLFFGRP